MFNRITVPEYNEKGQDVNVTSAVNEAIPTGGGLLLTGYFRTNGKRDFRKSLNVAHVFLVINYLLPVLRCGVFMFEKETLE